MTYPSGQPPYYQQPYQPPYGQHWQQPLPPPYAPPRKTNGFAIASLIFGIVGGILLSVILGIIALRQTKDGRQGGRGMAIAGLALSGAWTFFIAVAIVLVAVYADGSVRATDVKLGDCIETTPSNLSTVKRLPKVSCDKPHEGEVYALLPVSAASFPGQSTLRDEYEKKCLSALESYSSKASEDPVYQIFVLYPTQETWDQGDRRVACITITQDKRTGSVKE